MTAAIEFVVCLQIQISLYTFKYFPEQGYI